MSILRYGYLANVQVMAAVTVNDGVSSADAELTMYLGKACDFINDSLKGICVGAVGSCACSCGYDCRVLRFGALSCPK